MNKLQNKHIRQFQLYSLTHFVNKLINEFWKLFCLPGVFHYTEVVEDAEGSAFFDQVSNISTDIFVRDSPCKLQVKEFVSFLTDFIIKLISV